ncbi:spermatogenesis-associated serine-rich protein 1 isoform X2 [Desmodus rotundus]|uniref:spermatogenesis-associated serine-rich protein 1 isoform X2 n=1 Tax=Desmodus rotundus TaxID=9430 RepID=UPI0039E5BDFE
MLFSALKVDYIWNDLAGEVLEMDGSQTLPSRAHLHTNNHHRLLLKLKRAQMSLLTGNRPGGCQSPCISRTTCSGELEKVPEKVDPGTKHKDFLESEGCFSNTTSSGQRVGPSCSAVIGGNVSEPPAPCGVPAHLDPAADSDPKSSHSDHPSETSLPEVQKDKCLEEFSMLKSQTKDGQRPEWTFYPRFSNSIHTYHVGKQCFFKGVFLGNKRSLAERTVDKCLGRKKYDIDPRNGIPKLTPGDNLYMYPEQSKDFHKVGSTLPPVNFSLVPYEKKFDTFIPLEPLPQVPKCFGLPKTTLSRNRPTEHAPGTLGSLFQLAASVVVPALNQMLDFDEGSLCFAFFNLIF